MCHYVQDYEPDEEVLRIAGERGIPILGSPDATSNVAAEAIYFLTGKLAPWHFHSWCTGRYLR